MAGYCVLVAVSSDSSEAPRVRRAGLCGQRGVPL